MIRGLPGLSRYTAAKLTDGRVGVFNVFDTLENARKSSEEARKARGKSTSQLARALPSDPWVLEGTIIGTYVT